MLNLDIPTFPVLTTERLVLRQLQPADAADLHQLRADPEINSYIGRPASTGIDDALAFIDKIKSVTEAQQGMYWVLSLAGAIMPLIGTVCFWNFDQDKDNIELGYELSTACQGRGLMTEALNRVIKYGFEQMNAKAITAVPSAGNKRSIALLTKLGFTIDDELQADLKDEADPMLAFSLKR